ncbi:MAG: hypothetical protein LUD57_01565 [Ruminococcus sp.]|nr:hypothetical protein [Ruminococcus sp.]
MFDDEWSMIDKMIDDAADSCEELDDILEENGCTKKEALRQVESFKKLFSAELDKMGIRSRSSPIEICCGICDKLEEEENPPSRSLIFLYCAAVTDRGLLLNDGTDERDDEQDIRSFFTQKEKIRELSGYLEVLPNYHKRIESFKNKRNKARTRNNFRRESNLLLKIVKQYELFYKERNSVIFSDNIADLVESVNENELLKSLKPYAYMIALTSRTDKMMGKEGFHFNWDNLFKIHKYSIEKDNGKNFKDYQSKLELYDNLRSNFLNDSSIDIGFSDYCFAAYVNLSQWYEENCEPNEEIPKNPRQKAESVMSDFFPIFIECRESEGYDLWEFANEYPELETACENVLKNNEDIITDACNAVRADKDITPLANRIYSEIEAKINVENIRDREKALMFPKIFLVQKVKLELREKMLDAAMLF